MKTTLMALVCVAFLGASGVALAEDAAAKPDCSEKKKGLEDAQAAVKAAIKPDLSSCADKKGKEKMECEKPLKEKAKTDTADAKGKAKEAKAALDCCKNPKKKGCTP
jgi:hypothetical protein